MNARYEKTTTFIVEFTEVEYITLLGAMESFEKLCEKNQDNVKSMEVLKPMIDSMYSLYKESGWH